MSAKNNSSIQIKKEKMFSSQNNTQSQYILNKNKNKNQEDNSEGTSSNKNKRYST